MAAGTQAPGARVDEPAGAPVGGDCVACAGGGAAAARRRGAGDAILVCPAGGAGDLPGDAGVGAGGAAVVAGGAGYGPVRVGDADCGRAW